jgi:hypothetical protein
MLRPFPTIQCQRNYIPAINIDIIICVSTDKREGGGGGRDLVYKNTVLFFFTAIP